MVVKSRHTERLSVAVDNPENRTYRLAQEGRSCLSCQAIRGRRTTCPDDARVKARQLIIEPGLVRHRLVRCKFVRHGVKSLRKRLPGGFIEELVGRRVKIDAVGQIPAQAADIAYLHQHVPGQLALNRKIYAVALADLEVRVDREREVFSAESGDDRRGDWWNRRHR